MVILNTNMSIGFYEGKYNMIVKDYTFFFFGQWGKIEN